MNQDIEQIRAHIHELSDELAGIDSDTPEYSILASTIKKLVVHCRSLLVQSGETVCSDLNCCMSPTSTCKQSKHEVCSDHVHGCLQCFREMSGRRALVVDDEKVIADTLSTILNSIGLETRTSYDGQSAVESVRLWAPHFIISDVIMPGLNGIELAIHTRQILPDCRVVLFSGQAATADLAQAAAMRGYDFSILPKPVHPRDLLQCLLS